MRRKISYLSFVGPLLRTASGPLFFVMALATLMLLPVSCSDRSYLGQGDDSFDDRFLPVTLIAGNIKDAPARLSGQDAPACLSGQDGTARLSGMEGRRLATRGSGVMDDADPDVWEGASVYVYAFRRGKNVSFIPTSASRPVECLIDGSRDVEGCLAGKEAHIAPSNFRFIWTGRESDIYYPFDDKPYDFYAYHVDSAFAKGGRVTRTDKQIVLDIEIDGSDDVMSSYARLTKEQLSGRSYSQEELDQIRSAAFSFYTARRDIHPVMEFRHHLARVEFDIYPAHEDANFIYVQDIAIRSKTKGRFTVVDRDSERLGISFYGDRSLIYLTEKDGSPLIKDHYHTDYKGSYLPDPYNGTPVAVGGAILAAPDHEYEMTVTFKEKMPSGYERQYDVVKIIRTSGGFKEGTRYKVRIAIFNSKAITADTVVESWEHGGDIDIDEEN